MKHLTEVMIGLALFIAFTLSASAVDQTIPVSQDPLVRMPGTQPIDGVNLEGPGRCLNCHGGYDPAVEPGFNWKGSMMAQSARDPIFWACFTVAIQDSAFALEGSPNAADICERCHFPEGWLGGRSDPPNASAMTGTDFDGIHCDFCHRKWDPFFEDTHSIGDREISVTDPNFSAYWDEVSALSQTEAQKTYNEDWILSGAINLFYGGPFYDPSFLPFFYPDYEENASGQYFVGTGSQKRASFADAAARHQMLYSRYHKSKYFCSTCHDVSNPVLANLGLSDLPTDGTNLITEQHSAAKYFHVERTFSEFMLSAYGLPGGAATNPEFQEQGATKKFDVKWAAKCQDCHMRDLVGVGCNKKGVPVRPDPNGEHPNSGLPHHDLTGGNAWISHILASLDPNGPVYDPDNVAILAKGPGLLTLDLNQGETPVVNGAALKAGSDRALDQLDLAATILNKDGVRDQVTYTDGNLSFKIQNNSAHKLISGFPEGRRMFVNIKCYDANGDVIYEVNPYDAAAGTLKGLDYPYLPGMGLPDPLPLALNEAYVDELVYEVHPSSSLTQEPTKTFHFVLATGRYKDNRIPPKGFLIGDAAARHSEPVWGGSIKPDYFDELEYAGGYDEVSLPIADGATTYVEVTVNYQGTSREYIEFLRNEINGTPNRITLPDPAAYIVQTDGFFSNLREWGNTIWDLWFHNHGLDGSGKSVPGIVPYAMAKATWGAAPALPCDAPSPPVNLRAKGGRGTVTLTWDPSSSQLTGGYRVFYVQNGKLQHIIDLPVDATAYTDSGLLKRTQYCYAVTAWNDCDSSGIPFDQNIDKESAASEACATTR